MKATIALCALTLFSGAMIPAIAAANGALSKSLGGNIPYATLTLFVVGMLIAGASILLHGARPPELAAFRSAPWWAYTSGFIMAFYAFTITFVAPRLGVGTAIALILIGQVIGSLLIDNYGLMRSLVFPLTGARVVGAVLMAAGAYVAMKR
jgi:transporter family-2 protein